MNETERFEVVFEANGVQFGQPFMLPDQSKRRSAAPRSPMPDHDRLLIDHLAHTSPGLIERHCCTLHIRLCQSRESGVDVSTHERAANP